MQINIKTLIIPSILLFLLLSIKFSTAAAGAILFVILAGITFKIFIKKSKRKYLALNGIKSVPKELVFNSNTLTNNYCIVRYFQNKKIIVMDNPLSKEHRRILRAFIVDKTNHEDITACWNDVCSVYDEYTYLDTLYSFIDKASKRIGIMYLNHSTEEFTLDGMEEFLPKSETKTPQPNITNEKLVKKIEQTDSKSPIIVEFNDLTQKNIQPPPKAENLQNVVNIQDLTDDNKIDINLANPQVISELPGISTVMAEKIVEYRNHNGFFKSKEDFIRISEVKEHFKEKIFSMITVEKSSAVILAKELECEKERTVD